MALAVSPLGSVESPEQETPRIYSEHYRHSIVDSNWQPEQGLLTNVEGTPRLFEVYVPYLGRDEELFPFDPSNVSTYRSYSRIKRMVIWQEGSGAFNFDPTTVESDIKYNGWWVAPGHQPPSQFMVMIADIGDGLAGVFQTIETPEPKNVTANKAYYLTFQFLGVLTKEWNDLLVSRVLPTRDWTYSKDSALHGGSAVVTDDGYDIGQQLFQWNQTIANSIMRNFYWDPERTISWVNADKYNVYDQYLVNFLVAMMPGDYRNTYPMINQFSTEYGGREFGKGGDINIWEVLLRGDFNLLSQCKHRAHLIQVVRLWQTRMYGGLASSKFDLFVATDADRYMIYRDYINSDGQPIWTDGKQEEIDYLFSEQFYQGQPQGEFEEIVTAVVRDRLMDHKRLLEYCKKYFTLTKREQLYNGAILLMLLKVARVLRSPLT